MGSGRTARAWEQVPGRGRRSSGVKVTGLAPEPRAPADRGKGGSGLPGCPAARVRPEVHAPTWVELPAFQSARLSLLNYQLK